MLRKLTDFLRGTTRLEVRGAFPERFLNLCGAARLPFWGVERPEPGRFRVTVPLGALKKARCLASRAGCTLEELERSGLPVYLARLRARRWLLASLAAAALLVVLLSQFVLVITVRGNTSLSDSVILTELEKAGLSFGTWAPALDERQIANRVLSALPELSFLSVNRTGVYVEVVVHEATAAPELRDENTPTDVVASRDGVVILVRATSGSASVEAGDAVLAGEVLISHETIFPPAEWTDGVGSSMVSHARGEVWAFTERTFTAKTPLTVGLSAPAGSGAVRWSLRLGKSLLKFHQNSSNSEGNCVKIKEAWQVTLPGGIVLPVTLVRETLYARESGTGTVTEASAEAYLRARLSARLEAALDGGEVLSEDWETETKDGVLTVTLRASCLEDIAEEQTAAES